MVMEKPLKLGPPTNRDRLTAATRCEDLAQRLEEYASFYESRPDLNPVPDLPPEKARYYAGDFRDKAEHQRTVVKANAAQE